jgi:predicted Fe-Mo cluster-binding NifX family protein
MKIAIPTVNGKLAMHFGHCEQFAIVNVDDASKKITGVDLETPPPHEPGVLPRWLKDYGANIIISGGMGGRAKGMFENYGIQVVTGAPADEPKKVAGAWLEGNLVTGENACDH